MGGHAQQVAAGEVRDVVRTGHQRCHEAAVRRAVTAESLGGAVEVEVGEPGASAVERMPVRDRRQSQLDASGELELPEES
jgi:hypothetical protein